MSSAPRRPPTRAKPRKPSLLAARTWFAEFWKIPLIEIADAPAPAQAPWKSPLDRATYPRGGSVPLTAEYEAWLSSSVADLAAHFGNAYLDAVEPDDVRRRTLLAAARVLTATAASLIAGNLAALEDLGVRAKAAGSTPVRVPTRLYLRHLGSNLEMPFVIGGRDVARTSVQAAEALLEFFVSRIRLAACFLDGEPLTAKRMAADMAEAFGSYAPLLSLARTPVDTAAMRELAAQFTRLLHDCKPRTWSRGMPEEQLEAASRKDEKEFEKVAPRFARAALVACGYTPREARNLYEYRRKRRDRTSDGASTVSPTIESVARKPPTTRAHPPRSSSSAKASRTRRT